MLAISRRNAIKEQLNSKKSVTITELAEKLDVTKETIRRDLRSMQENGELIRTHGGAYILDGVQNMIDISMRQVIKTEEKKIIAQKCIDLIKPSDSIFLDGSTTAWFIAQQIRNMSLTVVTISLKIANILSNAPSIHLVLIGGNFSPKNMSFAGEKTCQALSQYYMDKAFVSCRSVSLEHGVTDSNDSDAALHLLALQHSSLKYLVMDQSKVDKTSFSYVCDLKDVTGLVCNCGLSKQWMESLVNNGIRFY